MSLYIPDIRSEKPEVRSGHICLTFRGNIFIWGGYNDADEDFSTNKYISSQSLWIYNINTCTWKHVSCSGDMPEGLSGACGSRIGQTLYVFAGHCKELGHSYNLYSLDLLTYRWKARSFNGKLPLARDKFGSWVIDNRIIYFGGYSTEPYRRRPYHGPFVIHQNHAGWTGQVAVLHTNQDDDELEWKYPICKGDPPHPRAAHGMTRIGSKGYLFGGRHSVCRDNDLHCLDLESLTWSGRLHVIGPEPCGRSWHVFVTCGPKHILLHGGFDTNNKELDDAWLLDVHSLTWIEIDAFKQMSHNRIANQIIFVLASVSKVKQKKTFRQLTGSNAYRFIYFSAFNTLEGKMKSVLQEQGYGTLHARQRMKERLRYLEDVLDRCLKHILITQTIWSSSILLHKVFKDFVRTQLCKAEESKYSKLIRYRNTFQET